jgi:hypothetical protein
VLQKSIHDLQWVDKGHKPDERRCQEQAAVKGRDMGSHSRELPVASLQAIIRTMACKASEISAQSRFSYFSRDTFGMKGNGCLQCLDVVRMNPDKTPGAASE